MKTIKVITKRVTVNHKYGPSSINYMVGRIAICYVKATQQRPAKYAVNSSILDIYKTFESQQEADEYCKSKVIPHFFKMLQHGIQ